MKIFKIKKLPIDKEMSSSSSAVRKKGVYSKKPVFGQEMIWDGDEKYLLCKLGGVN